MSTTSTQNDIICYGLTRGRNWQDEWYESARRDAGRRARLLRKAGFRVVVEGMGSQVTPVGLVKMTLLSIRIDSIDELYRLVEMDPEIQLMDL